MDRDFSGSAADTSFREALRFHFFGNDFEDPHGDSDTSVDSVTEDMFIDELDPVLDRTYKRRSLPTAPLNGSEERWRNADEDVEAPVIEFKPLKTPGPQLSTADRYRPLHLFQLFFSTSSLETIVKNTNAYGAKLEPWSDISTKDLNSFLALVVLMGLKRVPLLTDYWNPFYTSCPEALCLSYEKFKAIYSALHLSDPQDDAENEERRGTASYDPLCKIKPLYEELRRACKSVFHPSQNVAVSERMVMLKIRNKLKPTRFGYKLFALADSSCAYTWDLFMSKGKSDVAKDRGLGYEAVMALVDENLLGTGYKLFVPRFYTSSALFRELLHKQIWACGPVRPKRLGFPAVTENRLPKSAPNGSIRWFKDADLLFVEWKDREIFRMCTTIHQAYAGDTEKKTVRLHDGKKSSVEIPVPAALVDFHRNMKGADVSDTAVTYYSHLLESKKWYHSVFYHFVDIAIMNSFILHKQMAKLKSRRPLSESSFREKLYYQLMESSSSSDAPPGAMH